MDLQRNLVENVCFDINRLVVEVVQKLIITGIDPA